MQKFLLAIAMSLSIATADAQCVTNLDFNSWLVGGQPGNGNWVVQGGGTQVRQTVNGAPTFFYSPFELMNVHLSGTFRSTDFDDDWMGFVFSFLNPLTPTDSFDCWLFDWKQEYQGSSPRGMAINRVLGVIPPGNYGTMFNAHVNTPEFTVVQNDFGGPGWSWNNNHNFDLYLTYTSATIYVDGVLKFDVQDCFKPGRFGFYNLSQADCYYANFQYSLHIGFSAPQQVCRGASASLQFVNPCVNSSLSQYQSLTWDFGDGSPVLVNNNPTLANANVTHTYASAGVFTATLTVVDNTGCTATASRVIDVRNPVALTPILNQPPCNGGTNGSIGVTATGGFGNFSYSWNGGAASGSTWLGRPAGTYTVTVTDGVCNTTAQYTLNQPTPLSATTSHTDASCGLTNGSVTMAISGGTPPYANVTWAGVAGLSRTGLGPGTYIANFVDANACSAALQYTETVSSLPCGLSSSVNSTNVSCFGGSNGTATLTVTGTTGVPNVSWSNGSTGFTATGLSSGTYTYTYTDANPAHNFSGTVTITQPGAAMVAQLATIAITCAGINNGQAVASVTSGGTPAYTYTWSGGQPNNPVANNLAPGPISVTVTDTKGCTATASGTVSSVPSLNATFTMVIDSCFHSGNGSLTASVSGGSAPYTYAWNNFDQDSANLNIIEGAYTLTVTDANGCSITRIGTVTGPTTSLSSTFTSTNIACRGGSTGDFNVTVNGGVPAYTYAWTPNSVSGSNPTGLAAGIYTYTVTDSYGCKVYGIDTLLQPDSVLVATSSHTDVTCNGANDGSITITVGGGNDPYTYQGTPVPAGTTTLNNLPAGTYSGTLVDSAGCSVALSETILEPAALNISETHIDVLCNGGSTGSITLTITGGSVPIGYLWSDGNTSQNRTGLAAGAYSVTATDNSSCSASISVTITEPAAMSVTETHTDVLCNGGTTGSIDVTVAGGASPYAYIWNDGTTTTEDRVAIVAGTYSVTVYDNFQCSATLTAIVSEPTPLTVTTSHTDVTCNGANDGTLTINVSGGTGPYSYLGNPVPAGTTVLPNLPPGTYAGSVNDINGCSVAVSETITEPGPQSITVSGTNNPCFGATQGTATANFVNPTGIVTYNWTGGLSGANISNLSAGTYTVTATDQNQCALTDSVVVTEPAAVVMTVTTVDAICFGGNGSGTATPNGGTPPFTYAWSNGGSGQTSPLPAGNFTVTSTDAATCQQTASGTINQPTQIVIQETHTDNLCFGNSTAYIILSASGGTPGYTYQWTPNVSTNDSALNLTAGTYSAVVTDVNACTATQSVTITQPAVLDVTAVATDALCFGGSSGTITTTPTGGTSPYSFNWNDGNTNQNRINLIAGVYSMTVTDANSCIDSVSVNVGEEQQIVNVVSATDVSCYQYTDGQISVATSGGVPVYTYSLSSGAQNSSGIFTGLSVDSYTLTVTDANSCSVSESAVINEPPAVIVSVVPDVIEVDLGNSIQLQTNTNQTGTLTYNWQPNFGLSCYDCANPVFSGNNSVVYTLTIVNDLSCTGSAAVKVTVIPNYDVFIPNVFTPNGDGNNDTWSIFGNLTGVKQLQVMVFNRWGEKVFESTDIRFAWDGNYKGTYVQPGVYTYAAKFVWLDNHSDNNYKGTVTLLK